MAEHFDVSSKLIPRIGTAMGAGVILNGLLCGSISGVAMAIGIKYGRNKADENPQLAWNLVDGYVNSFKNEFGGVNCRQLTGLDLKTMDGLKEYYARVHDHECTKRLKFAVEKGAEIPSKHN